MATNGYSFQEDDNTIIDIDIDMNIVVEKEKNEWIRKIYLYFFSEINVYVGEKWRIFSCLTKLLTGEIF